MTISKSPNRYTFQRDGYIKRCEEAGKEPNEDYLDLFESFKDRDDQWANAEEHKHDLEWDMRTTDWILEKVRTSDTYAQNLYSAMCNNQFQKREVMPILKDEYWSCTWRSSGGIIADMRQEGDYIDWYCSGMGDGLGNGDENGTKGYVPEGTVTDEITEDLLKLGWQVVTKD